MISALTPLSVAFFSTRSSPLSGRRLPGMRFYRFVDPVRCTLYLHIHLHIRPRIKPRQRGIQIGPGVTLFARDPITWMYIPTLLPAKSPFTGNILVASTLRFRLLFDQAKTISVNKSFQNQFFI